MLRTTHTLHFGVVHEARPGPLRQPGKRAVSIFPAISLSLPFSSPFPDISPHTTINHPSHPHHVLSTVITPSISTPHHTQCHPHHQSPPTITTRNNNPSPFIRPLSLPSAYLPYFLFSLVCYLFFCYFFSSSSALLPLLRCFPCFFSPQKTSYHLYTSYHPSRILSF